MLKINFKPIIGVLLALVLPLSVMNIAHADDGLNPVAGIVPLSKVTNVTLGKVTENSAILKVSLDLDQKLVQTEYMKAIRDLRSDMWDKNVPFVDDNSPSEKLQDVAKKYGYTTKQQYLDAVIWSDVAERLALQRAVETGVHGKIAHARANGTAWSDNLNYNEKPFTNSGIAENLAWGTNVYQSVYNQWGHGELPALMKANGASNGESGHLHTSLHPMYKYHGIGFVKDPRFKFEKVTAGFYTNSKMGEEKLDGSLQGKQDLEVLVAPVDKSKTETLSRKVSLPVKPDVYKTSSKYPNGEVFLTKLGKQGYETVTEKGVFFESAYKDKGRKAFLVNGTVNKVTGEESEPNEYIIGTGDKTFEGEKDNPNAVVGDVVRDYYKNSTSDLEFIFKGKTDKLITVKVDGIEVPLNKIRFTAKSDNEVKVVVDREFLNTLNEGKHVLRTYFLNGTLLNNGYVVLNVLPPKENSDKPSEDSQSSGDSGSDKPNEMKPSDNSAEPSESTEGGKPSEPSDSNNSKPNATEPNEKPTAPKPNTETIPSKPNVDSSNPANPQPNSESSDSTPPKKSESMPNEKDLPKPPAMPQPDTDSNVSTENNANKVNKKPIVMLSKDKEYNTISGKEFVVRLSAAFEDFIDVSVDGKKLTDKEVKVTSGSTIFTFTPEYLKSLTSGVHEMTANFKEGKENVGGTFTVKFNVINSAKVEENNSKLKPSVEKVEAKTNAKVESKSNAKAKLTPIAKKVNKLPETGANVTVVFVLALMLLSVGFIMFRKEN